LLRARLLPASRRSLREVQGECQIIIFGTAIPNYQAVSQTSCKRAIFQLVAQSLAREARLFLPTHAGNLSIA